VVVVEASQTPDEKRFPVFTQANLASAMKVVGGSFTAARAALATSNVASAKLQFLHAREELAPTITFWRDYKKDDAIKSLRDALSRLDGLDTALSTPNVAVADAKVLVDQVETACEACHAVYREQNQATKAFRLRPGSLE
jgi:hypothetical protein